MEASLYKYPRFIHEENGNVCLITQETDNFGDEYTCQRILSLETSKRLFKELSQSISSFEREQIKNRKIEDAVQKS